MTSLNRKDYLKELHRFLEQQGYYQIRELPDGRVIALLDLLFTTGVFVDVDFGGYNHRYCYENRNDAIFSIRTWDGKEDTIKGWVAKK